MNRYYHRRMTADEFSRALDELGMSVGEWMRFTGLTRRTVEMHLGQIVDKDRPGDIPHWVPVLLELLRLPGGIEAAERVTGEREVQAPPRTDYRDTRRGDRR